MPKPGKAAARQNAGRGRKLRQNRIEKASKRRTETPECRKKGRHEKKACRNVRTCRSSGESCRRRPGKTPSPEACPGTSASGEESLPTPSGLSRRDTATERGCMNETRPFRGNGILSETFFLPPSLPRSLLFLLIPSRKISRTCLPFRESPSRFSAKNVSATSVLVPFWKKLFSFRLTL